MIAICLQFWSRWQRQISLLDRVEAAGGEYDTEPVGPEWLRDFLGEGTMRGFDDVVRVVVGNSIIDDNLLMDISTLSQIESLALTGKRVTDAELVYLKGLTNLETLHLYDTRITDAGLAHLKGLTNLEVLDLSGIQVSDAGLVHLKGMTNLEGLALYGTQVSDGGLIHLRGLTNLRMLDLRKTQVSDTGEKTLKAGLPNCAILWYSSEELPTK